MQARVMCVTCGGDRTGENPRTSCQHEYDYGTFTGEVRQAECGETDVFCLPNELNWAAADMLAALKRVVAELDWKGGEDGGWTVPDDNWLAEVRAAIAKAEGRKAWC